MHPKRILRPPAVTLALLLGATLLPGCDRKDEPKPFTIQGSGSGSVTVDGTGVVGNTSVILISGGQVNATPEQVKKVLPGKKYDIHYVDGTVKSIATGNFRLVVCSPAENGVIATSAGPMRLPAQLDPTQIPTLETHHMYDTFVYDAYYNYSSGDTHDYEVVAATEAMDERNLPKNAASCNTK